MKHELLEAVRLNSILLVGCGVLAACSSTAPSELVGARVAYQRAAEGPAADLALADLHIANEALVKAEQSFRDQPNSYRTRDLSYVAERKAQIAEAKASIAMEKREQERAEADFQATQAEIVETASTRLEDTQTELGVARSNADTAAKRLEASEVERAAATERADAALAKLAEVEEGPRGTVITLSGSVLFASNRSTLLEVARSRLDQVADVLLANRERQVIIEGHTDSRGSSEYNRELSQRRADAVRDYLVQRDYEADLIEARGLGEAQPVAGNDDAEGRANNRRVEIIIKRTEKLTTR